MIYTDIVVLEGEALPQHASAVLQNELLQPPVGLGWIVVDGLPWGNKERSVLEDADPPAETGDVLEWDLLTDPGGFGVTMYPQGAFSLNDDDYTSQTFDYRLWRQATATWYGPETVTLPASPRDGVGEVSQKVEALGVGYLPGSGANGTATVVGLAEIWALGEVPQTVREGQGEVSAPGNIVAIGERPASGLSAGKGSVSDAPRAVAIGLLEAGGVAVVSAPGSVSGLGESPLPAITEGAAQVSSVGEIRARGVSDFRSGSARISGAAQVVPIGVGSQWARRSRRATVWIGISFKTGS